MEDARGNHYTYDINGTTNYNQALGATTGVDGMRAVARYVRRVADTSPGSRGQMLRAWAFDAHTG